MSQTVVVQLELPKDWRKFRMPSALHSRLQNLLDRQDSEGKLSSRERAGATAGLPAVPGQPMNALPDKLAVAPDAVGS